MLLRNILLKHRLLSQKIRLLHVLLTETVLLLINWRLLVVQIFHAVALAV